jgi:hypothetical protein
MPLLQILLAATAVVKYRSIDLRALLIAASGFCEAGR